MTAAAPDAIVLHIGVHKTGSTALQSALAAARPALARAGVLYPGSETAHHSAAWAATGFRMGFGDEATTPHPRKWSGLVRQVQRHRGRVMISSEFFGRMRPKGLARVVRDLGPDRVHVLVAVRPLADLLASSWQQYLKTGLTVPYEVWLTDVLRNERPGTTSGFWFRADFARLVKRWSVSVPPERITAVALDPADRSLLFRTTEELLGLTRDFLDPYRAGTPSNRSLTAGEAELVRRVNDRVADQLGWQRYAATVRHGAIRAVVEERRPPDDELRIETPQWALDLAYERQKRDLRKLRHSGVDLRGAPGLLRRPRTGAPALAPADVAIEAAATALLGAILGTPRSDTGHRRWKEHRDGR